MRTNAEAAHRVGTNLGTIGGAISAAADRLDAAGNLTDEARSAIAFLRASLRNHERHDLPITRRFLAEDLARVEAAMTRGDRV